MREVLSGLLMRITLISIPLLVFGDLSRALGRGVSVSLLVFAILLPIIGLIADAIRVRQMRNAVDGMSSSVRSLYLRPLQFRLRTLFLVMAVASVYCAFRFSPAVRQKQTVSELRAAGVPIEYDHSTATWLEGLFGPEMFGTVKRVTLRSDDEVAKIVAIPGVRQVTLFGSGVTDACIETLIRLPQLKELTVDNTRVGAGGIERFKQARPDCTVVVYPR